MKDEIKTFYCPNCNQNVLAPYRINKCPDCGSDLMNVEYRITENENGGQYEVHFKSDL